VKSKRTALCLLARKGRRHVSVAWQRGRNEGIPRSRTKRNRRRRKKKFANKGKKKSKPPIKVEGIDFEEGKRVKTEGIEGEGKKRLFGVLPRRKKPKDLQWLKKRGKKKCFSGFENESKRKTKGSGREKEEGRPLLYR